ncbi:unnamed protein product [Rhizoctonia solani]|uniref:Uncharacterized protein n=1 Tax=Rhizoctonia solani TaxID=456999 RepID=A0A8H3HVH5_9AGAM|nr:unnamed protein product [Rhizoctonia solani]
MEENSTVDKHPRRLVVNFWGYVCTFLMRISAFAIGDDSAKADSWIKTNDGDRPQLVHTLNQNRIKQPSRVVRFARRLGLTKGDKPVFEAVDKAHRFITRNYAPGDQLILCVSTNDKWETDRSAKVLDVLARHLHDGTIPAKLANAQPGNGGDITGRQIPIYGVVVYPSLLDEIHSITTWSDWLKSRFPPGIQHIVCYSYDDGFHSCSTTYDLDSGMTSRELRFSNNDRRYELQIDATKHILYYEQDMLPEWDEHQPVWTRAINPSSHRAQVVLPLESIQPAGMHHHEVKWYHDLPGLWGNGTLDVLVWKSCQKEPN